MAAERSRVDPIALDAARACEKLLSQEAGDCQAAKHEANVKDDFNGALSLCPAGACWLPQECIVTMSWLADESSLQIFDQNDWLRQGC